MRRFALLVAGLALLAGIAATVSGGGTQAQPRWVITDLGTLGGWGSWPFAINEAGQVVGSADIRAEDPWVGAPHAFLWQSGRMTDLGTRRGAKYSRAVAINDHGQVAGYSYSGVTELTDEVLNARAFLWANGKTTDLGTLGGREAIPDDINGRAQVVGWSEINLKTGYGHAFRWQSGRMTDPGALGATSSHAYAINEVGLVVGCSAKSGGNHAFLWQSGRMTDLGTLGGKESCPSDLNVNGQVVGWSRLRSGYPSAHAFLWQAGKMRDLGTLPGTNRSEAVALNARGQVVGVSELDTADAAKAHAFLWRAGRMSDLGEGKPVAINDRAQIVGTHYVSGNPRACLWQDGRLIILPKLGGNESGTVAINNRGQIVGWSATKKSGKHAVLWTLKP
jgi:probable HAF family extracellular repeat protein